MKAVREIDKVPDSKKPELMAIAKYLCIDRPDLDVYQQYKKLIRQYESGEVRLDWFNAVYQNIPKE